MDMYITGQTIQLYILMLQSVGDYKWAKCWILILVHDKIIDQLRTNLNWEVNTVSPIKYAKPVKDLAPNCWPFMGLPRFQTLQRERLRPKGARFWKPLDLNPNFGCF